MGLWSDRALPTIVDRSLSSAEIAPMRAAACRGLHGRVLEIGFGSGLNIEHYPPAVASVAAVEPSDKAWRLSEQRRSASPIAIERTGLDGQRLGAADASYDCVLSTFTLCTLPDLPRALTEVRRVLAPGGALHFLEHGLAPEPGVARWQGRLDPVQKRVFGGCHLSRDTPALLRDAGFEIVDLRQEYLPGPRLTRPWSYGYLGRAVPD